MKKLQVIVLVLLSCGLSLFATPGKRGPGRPASFTKISDEDSLVTKKGYTAFEYMVELIEDGKNRTDSFVVKYTVQILMQKDPVTGYFPVELARMAENLNAADSMQEHINDFHKQNRYKRIATHGQTK